MVMMCMIRPYNDTHPYLSMSWSYFCLPRPAMAETEFKLRGLLTAMSFVSIRLGLPRSGI